MRLDELKQHTLPWDKVQYIWLDKDRIAENHLGQIHPLNKQGAAFL